MDKKEIIILSVVVAFAAIRIYQKYVKKNIAGADSKPPSGTSFPSSPKDEEYEPYSKK